MPRILVCDLLAEEGLEILRKAGEVIVSPGLSEDELIHAASGVDAIVVRSGTRITAPVIEAATRLRIIARAGVGVDNIDVPAATRCGVIVVNSPWGNTLAATEHTFAMMLAAARHVPQAAASMRAGRWERKLFMGHQLFGKTLGVVGLGKIGAEVTRRAVAFGMEVLAFDPFITESRAAEIGAKIISSLPELAAQVDFLTLHCALTPDTVQLANAALLSSMKPGSVLINCARGGLVDEAALLDALRDGPLAAAALDVFADEPPSNSELIALPNVIATPHVGASTFEAQTGVAVDVAQQVAAVLQGHLPAWPINTPRLSDSERDIIEPYLTLVTGIARMARALTAGPLKAVSVATSDDLDAAPRDYIVGQTLATLLEGAVDAQLNVINAMSLASERGIELTRSKIQSNTGYSHLIEIRVESSAGELTIGGALLDSSGGRIVSLDGYRFEIVPQGTLVLIWNALAGKPGFVGSLGAVLGNAGINISGIQVAPEIFDGVGFMAVRVEDAISDQVLLSITKISGVQRVAIARL